MQSTGICWFFQLFRVFILVSVGLLSACSAPEDAPEQRTDLSVAGALSADIRMAYHIGKPVDLNMLYRLLAILWY